MKEKYIEERIPRWMVFGQHQDGCVDIVDRGLHNSPVVNHVSEELARQMIEARDMYVDDMVAYWTAHPTEWCTRISNG